MERRLNHTVVQTHGRGGTLWVIDTGRLRPHYAALILPVFPAIIKRVARTD